MVHETAKATATKSGNKATTMYIHLKRLLVSFVGRKTYCVWSQPHQRREREREKKTIAEDNHLVSATVNCHPFNSFMFVPSEITHSEGFN